MRTVIIVDCSVPQKLQARINELDGDWEIRNIGYESNDLEYYSKYEQVILAVKIDSLKKDDNFGHICTFPNGHKYIRTIPMSSLISTSYELITIFLRHCKMMSNQVTQIKIPKQNVHLIKTIKQFDKMLDKLHDTEVIAYDIETKNLNKLDNKILTLQFAINDHTSFVLPYKHLETPFSTKQLKYIQRGLVDYFENGKSKFHIMHNAVFDVGRTLTLLGVKWYNHNIFDTMAALYAIDENRKQYHFYMDHPYSLKSLCKEYGIGHLYDTGALGKSDRTNLDHESLEDVAEYGYKDVISIYMIARAMIKEEGKDFAKYVLHQLGRTSHIIAILESNGIKVDRELCASYNSETGFFNTKLKEKEAELLKLPSVQNVLKKKHGFFKRIDLSKKEDKEALFIKELKLNVDVSSKGNLKFGGAFKKSNNELPEVKLYNEMEEIKHLKSTFITGIYERLSNPDTLIDSRVRAHYGYQRVLTGRLSCVAGWTPVLTDNGIKSISDIRVGDCVFTHKLRWRKVTNTIIKGIDNAYDVHLSNGELLTCTDEHRFLTEQGWKTLKEIRRGCFPKSHQRQTDDKTSTSSVQGQEVFVHEGNSTAVVHKNNKRAENTEVQFEAYRVQGIESYEIRKTEDRKIESNVRQKIRQVLSLAWTTNWRCWLSEHIVGKEWSKRAVSQSCVNEETKDNETAKRLCDSSHRWKPFEQRDRQLSTMHKTGAHETTCVLIGQDQTVRITSVNYRGCEEIYDITVEEDASYLSCGVFSHNSYDPNYQQLPSGRRTTADLTQKIRSQFITEPGNVFVKCDYAAHEVRIWGIMSQDLAVADSFSQATNMIRKIRLEDAKGKDTSELVKLLATEGDAHSLNYRKMYGKWPENKQERGKAKTFIFQRLYGGGLPAIAKLIGEKETCERKQASEWVKAYMKEKVWK